MVVLLVHYDKSCFKRLWSYIKKQRKDNFSVASLRQDNNTYNDNQTKAQMLNNYFTLVFTQNHLPSIHESPLPNITTLCIDVDGVFNLLNELDIYIAPGPDKIPANFLAQKFLL